MWQTIINQIPPHEVYIEPFLGGGAVMLHKLPAKRQIGIDLDPDALDAFRISSRHLRLSQLEVLCTDALDWLREHSFKMAFDPHVFLYLDPPYPLGTRTSGTRYKYEMDDAAHSRLLRYIRHWRCSMAISSYPNALYEDLLADWRKIDYVSVARSGEPRTERLYMNYPEPGILHDDRFIGVDAANRQDINRRIARTVKRVARWPKRERVKMLRQLLAHLPDDEISHLRQIWP